MLNNSVLPVFFALLLLTTHSSTSEAANLRRSTIVSGTTTEEDDNSYDKFPSSDDGMMPNITTNGMVVMQQSRQQTQSECLSEKYPYATAVVDAMHSQVAGRDKPLVASNITGANEVYKIVAAAIRETDQHHRGGEEAPRFLCVSGIDDLYCVRNCEYPDLAGRPFCQAVNGSSWVANWANRELQGSEDTRFRIVAFDPYNLEQPLGEEILLIDAVGRGFARDRYYWATNGWLLDPPKNQDTDNNNCLGCPTSVLTETYTRGYTLAGGSPVRQGIVTAGVTLPELPEDYPVTSTISDRSDPAFVHPMYDRINAICPCC